ncbi:MAG: threonine ammonia-lyase [Pseudomonadota bacterium]|nr:threonine ammonia-lyase [Pseudomonadota bacterium]
MTVTIAHIRDAAAALDGLVVRTPLVHSKTLSGITGAELFLKLENLQYTASFKERGALNRLRALSDDERKAGVIALSAGNHAQAVAYHADRLGIEAVIVMPDNTPFIKVSNTQNLGARVELHGDNLNEASQFAHSLADEKGYVIIDPYDDDLVMAGQGTLAIEMLEQNPDLDILVAPIGGGGLIAGCAVAAKALAPKIEIIGVEAALYPSMKEAIEGAPATAEGHTIAEGIAVNSPGALTQPIIEKLVSEILLVSEGAIEQAVHLIAEIEKLVTEGAGAAPLAAVIENHDRFAGKNVGLVISGGNIDSRLLASVLMRGLVRSGRLVRVRIEATDLPGSLARVTGLIGEHGGNIIEVDHERWYYDVPVRFTELDLLIETRDADNARDIVQALINEGFPTRMLSSAAMKSD